MIYLIIKGRIGNQLFMYAAAKALQMRIGGKHKIVIDDSLNLYNNYLNSLQFYDLPDTIYDKDKEIYQTLPAWKRKCFDKFIQYGEKLDINERWKFEKKYQRLMNFLGIYAFEYGYYHFPNKNKKNIIMSGYFQSEKFFDGYRNEIKKLFAIKEQVDAYNYPYLEQIQARNTVCLSIKIEDNIGSIMYHVCTEKYWKEAIELMCKKVDNPLFFLCSDDVAYVKESLIDCSMYDIIEQDKNAPVHISLSVMSQCKHFIIGNTTFGWWAQYLCNYKQKIVIAPAKWYGIERVNDIYQDSWTLIEV